MPIANALWNDHTIDLLKKAWTIGKSASQIAAQIPGATRSAVIGKVHRLGLEARANPASKHARRPNRQKTEPSLPRLATSRLSPVAKRLSSLEKSRAVDSLPPEPPPQPRGYKPGLMQLGKYDCKWPLGDVRHPEFHYCGAPMKGEGPYCAGHAAMAFVKAPPVVRQKVAA